MSRRWRLGSATCGERHAEEEHPAADRHEVEHPHEVVGRRVVGPLLVARVEAVEIRGEDPRREREREDRELEHVGDAVVDRRAGPPHHGDDEGRAQADHVGGRKRTANEPAAPLDDLAASMPLDDPDRLGIEPGRELIEELSRSRCSNRRPSCAHLGPRGVASTHAALAANDFSPSPCFFPHRHPHGGPDKKYTSAAELQYLLRLVHLNPTANRRVGSGHTAAVG